MKSGVQMENDILELERPELFGLITVPIRGDNRGKLVAVDAEISQKGCTSG